MFTGTFTMLEFFCWPYKLTTLTYVITVFLTGEYYVVIVLAHSRFHNYTLLKLSLAME
jgi:hypothetical protein